MPKRRCRNPIRTDGLTMGQVIELAMEKLQWTRKKVLSWYELENPSLNHSRPCELVDRGDTDKITAYLHKREADRIAEDERRGNALEAMEKVMTKTQIKKSNKKAKKMIDSLRRKKKKKK